MLSPVSMTIISLDLLLTRAQYLMSIKAESMAFQFLLTVAALETFDMPNLWKNTYRLERMSIFKI